MTHPSLFSESGNEPLAARMRPRTLDEFAGQEQILGQGRLLRRMIQADMVTSVIFNGPPGCGKTTLAQIIANTTKSAFIAINAVLDGVAKVRETIEKAKQRRGMEGVGTILFVDEVHRWNKAQQDALLPSVENGTIALIGATTQNPFFEVIPALVSRSRIFSLRRMERDDMKRIAHRALTDEERGYGKLQVSITDEALAHLIKVADGDARSLLNAIQLAVETTPEHFPPPPGTKIDIDLSIAEESIQQHALLYDKDGDYHYDAISAFIKSLRGSDPDAALYWLANMMAAGEDPRYLLRRMLVLAAEDVGLAHPQALSVVEAAAAAFDRVGMPEGQFHLAQAALYLSVVPKSNSVLGYFDALKAVEEGRRHDVPTHLKDIHRDAEGFGHGKGYRYPHAWEAHWVTQNYLPVTLQDRIFYIPSNQGWEETVRDEVERKRALQLEAMLDDGMEDGLDREMVSWTPENRKDRADLAWLMRDYTHMMDGIRRRLFSDEAMRRTALARTHRILVVGNGIGFLVWEAVKCVPEGDVVGICLQKKELETVTARTERLAPERHPELLLWSESFLSTEKGARTTRHDLHARQFEYVVIRNLLRHRSADEALRAMRAVYGTLVTRGYCSLVEMIPSKSQRLSELVEQSGRASSSGEPSAGRGAQAAAQLHAIEDALFGGGGAYEWDEGYLAELASESGLEEVVFNVETYIETRIITARHLAQWVTGEHGLYAKTAAQLYRGEERTQLCETLTALIGGRELEWRVAVAFVHGRYGKAVDDT